MNKSMKETGRKKSISREEYKRILDLARPNLRDWFLLYLIGNLGLRVGECIRFKVEDFWIGDSILKIPRIKIRNKRLKKGELSGEYDELPLMKESHKHIKRYLTFYKIEKGWLFPGRDSNHISESRAQKIFYKYARSLGINASIHSLRHYRGYSLYDVTTDILAVKTILRHKSIRSSEIYTEPTLEIKRKLLMAGGFVDETGTIPLDKEEEKYNEEDRKKLRVHHIITGKKWKKGVA